jgi:hypothetical protein
MGAWVPLTIAMNSFNRGTGLTDLYLFVLSTPAVAELRSVHEGSRRPKPANGGAARAWRVRRGVRAPRRRWRSC